MIISNNALKYFDRLPKDLVVRINIAWLKSIKELELLLKNSTHDIYLDCATGRTKYPKPKISLQQVLPIIKKLHRIKYLAISNSESPDVLHNIRKVVSQKIIIVPKIETQKGISNLESICKAAETKVVMLDKEDLYYNLNRDNQTLKKWLTKLNRAATKNNIRILRLQGVIFDYDF